MATLLAHIQTFPGKETDFEKIMSEMYRDTHATEPDCLRYEYWRGEARGFYYCLLSFKDNIAFWNHQASDHHERNMPNFAACIEDLKLEILDPVSSASPLPAASGQQLPVDASDAVKKQAQQVPVKLASWWLQQAQSHRDSQ